MKPSNGFDFELPVLMTDPAVAYLPGEGYGPFDRGTQTDVWLKAANNSSPFLGAVWPGVTVFPGELHTTLRLSTYHISILICSRLVQRKNSGVRINDISIIHTGTDFCFSYWNNEFQMFYSPQTGLDIDGAWIDMNEPSSVRIRPHFDKERY